MDEAHKTFTAEEIEKLSAEAKEKWGHTDTYKQSEERYGKLSDDDKKRLADEADALMKEVATHIGEDPASGEVQLLMAQHYAALSNFYEPSVTIYRGLADMFIADPRFAAFYEKYAPGLAQFMHDAMIAYCDAHQ